MGEASLRMEIGIKHAKAGGIGTEKINFRQKT